jgi:hypothetical protein
MYTRRLTADDINNAVSDARIDQRMTSARVDSLLSNDRIDQRVTSARVDSLLSNTRIDQRVTSARVNELVDLGFIKTGVVLVSDNSEVSVNLGAPVIGVVASFAELDDVETACGATYSGNSITIRNSSGSQQNISYVALVNL